MSESAREQPAYANIRDDLLRDILGGVYRADDRLPSEPELAALYGVSRMTARHALSELVNLGSAYRVHGSGTFVKTKRIESSRERFLGFKADMEARGYSISSRVLFAGIVEPDELQIRLLKIPAGSRLAELRRIRCVQDIPLVFQRSYYRESTVPGFLERHFESESVYAFLEKSCGLALNRATERLEASVSDPALSELLQIAPGSAILNTRRLVYDAAGIPVELSYSAFRGDSYSFDVELGKEAISL